MGEILKMNSNVDPHVFNPFFFVKKKKKNKMTRGKKTEEEQMQCACVEGLLYPRPS
jgi:hypothetical protein